MSDAIAAFIRDRLDDEERAATAARHDSDGRWTQADPGVDDAIMDDAGDVVVYDEGRPTEEQAAHIAANDPARVLRQTTAIHAVILRCARVIASPSPDAEGWPKWLADDTLKDLAAIWQGHEAYRKEWTT